MSPELKRQILSGCSIISRRAARVVECIDQPDAVDAVLRSTISDIDTILVRLAREQHPDSPDADHVRMMIGSNITRAGQGIESHAYSVTGWRAYRDSIRTLLRQLDELDGPPAPRLSPTSKPVLPVLLQWLETQRCDLPVAAWLEERKAVGIATYGIELHTDIGRSSVQDCREELLDALLYGQQALMEGHDVTELVQLAELVLERLRPATVTTGLHLCIAERPSAIWRSSAGVCLSLARVASCRQEGDTMIIHMAGAPAVLISSDDAESFITAWEAYHAQ